MLSPPCLNQHEFNDETKKHPQTHHQHHQSITFNTFPELQRCWNCFGVPAFPKTYSVSFKTDF